MKKPSQAKVTGLTLRESLIEGVIHSDGNIASFEVLDVLLSRGIVYATATRIFVFNRFFIKDINNMAPEAKRNFTYAFLWAS